MSAIIRLNRIGHSKRLPDKAEVAVLLCVIISHTFMVSLYKLSLDGFANVAFKLAQNIAFAIIIIRKVCTYKFNLDSPSDSFS